MLTNVALSLWTRFTVLKDESGQALAEYSLILALVAVACIIALGVLATGIGNELKTVAEDL